MPGGEAGAQAELRKMIRDREAPGVQYAFVDAEGVRFSAQHGMADLQQQVPVTPDTVFHGYSVTKTLTAAAVLKLAAERRVELDAPVSRYLAGASPDPSPTLRQVLSHTGGYANPIPLAWTHLVRDEATFDEQAFYERIIAKHGKLARAPGEELAYSNVGYLVLGEVVRRVSGRRLSQYVEEELIRPLGLGAQEQLRFSFGDRAEHARGYINRWSWLNLVLGFFIDRDAVLDGSYQGWTQFKDIQVDGDAYGGVMGNSAGFARYLRALLRRQLPFTPELVELLFSQSKTSAGDAVPMGLSWFRGQLGGEPYFDHAGGGGGFYCELRVYPRLGVASVILFNRTGIKNDHLLDRIDPYLLPAGAGTVTSAAR